ncbi:MAG: alanyl-tRNA editing protein [Lachnospiraceae bacterium]|nr:alanyl-tRNA editing protein [Lachnospiraceae bacterium]
MTEKLYEKHSTQKECTTVVTECVKEDGAFYIKLKASIFFPEEGGQYSDTGTVCTPDKTVHILKGELLGSSTEGETDVRYQTDGELPVGTEVRCTLDWNNRFDRMQNHSGEHILSGLLHSRYGYHNTGFHLSDTDPVTVDTDGPLTDTQITELEKEANAVIYENLPIKDSYPTKEELGSLQYRSKIDIAGQVRLITIGNEGRIVDTCACCAPHVSTTGAIGIIKILSAEKFRGGTRLSILCGRRAAAWIAQNLAVLQNTAVLFSTRPEQLLPIAEKLKEDNHRLHTTIAELTEELLSRDIRAGVFEETVCTQMELGAVSMKNLYNTLRSLRDGYCGIFCGSDEDGYRYYAGGKELDARVLAAEMKTALDAKGGGSAEMIQGKITARKDEIEAFFTQINQTNL